MIYKKLLLISALLTDPENETLDIVNLGQVRKALQQFGNKILSA
jgi:hypothetical protein